ncbi:MAG: YciI family protein [Alphaproteobacteria bacterium]|nr:YciI family protein [Alphaproteobacteria bacterium]
MPLFVVTCVDKPGHAPVRAANRDAHLDFVRAAGRAVVVAGPTLTDDLAGMNGSVLVLDFPDRAAVEAHLARDPYSLAGLFESVTIRPFKLVIDNR